MAKNYPLTWFQHHLSQLSQISIPLAVFWPAFTNPSVRRSKTPFKLKTLFIHIGLHKTGSTALQLWMRHNDKILASHGVFVPKVGTFNEESGHHRVAWEMRDDKRNEGQNHHIDDLVNELVLCPCQKALISSEDFEYLSTAPVLMTIWLSITSSFIMFINFIYPDALTFPIF